jgi:predicted nucleotidyltransferase
MGRAQQRGSNAAVAHRIVGSSAAERTSLQGGAATSKLQNRRLREARAVCRALISQGADAVALFGSLARGDANAESDIDLLVVCEEAMARDDFELPDVPSEIAFTTWRRVQAPGTRQWAFLTLVGSEAEMLHDPKTRLARALANLPTPSPEDVEADCAQAQLKLENYTHIERFGGLYLSLFADCYRYAKGAILTASAYSGQPLPRRDDAFAWFIDRHPELAADVATVRTIEPHYLLTMNKGSEETLPFSANNCDERALAVLDAAKRICKAAAADSIAAASASHN